MFDSIPFFSWLLFIFALFSFGIAFDILHRRLQTMTVWFAGALIGYGIETFGYGFEISSATAIDAQFWVTFQFVGASFIPPSLLMASLSFQNIKEPPKSLAPVLLGISVLFSVMQLTNQWHHLGFNVVDIKHVGNLTISVPEFGVCYVLIGLYVHLCLIASNIVLIHRARRSPDVIRKQIYVLLLGLNTAWLTYFLYIYGFAPFNLDITVFGFIFSAIAFSIAIYRYQLGALKPIARETIFEQINDAYIVIDSFSRITDFNNSAQKVFPTLTNGLGKHDELILPTSVIHANSGDTVTLPSRQKFTVMTTPVRHAKGNLVGRVISLRNVSEQENLLSRLRYLAEIDTLTSLPNRTKLLELLKENVTACQLLNQPLCIIMWDIKGFRNLNIDKGYVIADNTLLQVSHAMQSLLPKRAIIGRFISDQFMLILPRYDKQQATQIMDEWKEKLEKDLQIEFHAIAVERLNQEDTKNYVSRILAESGLAKQHYYQTQFQKESRTLSSV
jgi:diguanylate cyclase (GGDEF)-like protein